MTLGEPGGGGGAELFAQPNAILVAPNGDFFVAEGHASRAATDSTPASPARLYKFSKDGKLIKLDSNTDDNGKRFIVSAVAEAAGLRVRVNNVERMARPDVWLTSYWTLPDPKMRNNVIPIIDADNGKDLSAKLQFVATEQRVVAGQNVSLNHYRLAGTGLTVDLWYDGSERLVRQDWVEQGHRTTLELTRVRR